MKASSGAAYRLANLRKKEAVDNLAEQSTYFIDALIYFAVKLSAFKFTNFAVLVGKAAQ